MFLCCKGSIARNNTLLEDLTGYVDTQVLILAPHRLVYTSLTLEHNICISLRPGAAVHYVY